MAISATLPKRRADVKWKRVGQAGILLDLKSGDYFETDDIGVCIWKMLDGKTSVEGVAIKLAKSYDAPLAAIKRDVAAFVEELQKRKLVEIGKG